MSTTVTYKGETLTTVNNQTRTLETAGTYLEDDITLVDVSQSAPVLQAKTNIAPTTSSQTITPDVGYDGLSSVQINAMPTGTAGTPTATKGAVSNHAVSVTPKVTNTTGYITGSTKTGTAVSVSASELVSGTKSITENGTGIDVTNYASVDVNVNGGGGGGAEKLYILVDVTGMLSSQVVIGAYGYLTTRVAYYGGDLVQGASVTLYTYGDYILDTITGETSGNTIPYTTVSRGTYTFTMPNESVYCSLLYDD